MEKTTEFVKHNQGDARRTVTFVAALLLIPNYAAGCEGQTLVSSLPGAILDSAVGDT